MPCWDQAHTTGGQHCKYNGQRASDINSAEASGHDSHAQHDQKKSLKIYISICFYLLYLKSLLSWSRARFEEHKQ